MSTASVVGGRWVAQGEVQPFIALPKLWLRLRRREPLNEN
jgi:hypothetical protein